MAEEKDSTSQATSSLEAQYSADQKRGIVVNVAGVLILLAISIPLGLLRYAGLALVLQWGTFLVHGAPFNSEKYYDASGSLTHLCLTLTALLSDRVRHPRQVITAVFVVIWLVRLGNMLFMRIMRDQKDGRFDALKTNTIRFLGVWTIQAVWVFLVDLPVLIVNAQTYEADADMGLTWQDYIGFSLWLVGFFCELIADAQKFVFRSKPENRHSYITSGLWKYSRHPNYFGEILMWCAICMSCSSAWTGIEWLGLLSPAFTSFLLLKATGVPLVEAAGLKQWGNDKAYVHYMTHTSCIIPMAPAPPLPKEE